MPSTANPQTLFDKLWQRHLVEQTGDGEALLCVDRHLVCEVTGPQAFEGLRFAARLPSRRETVITTVDHNVPTTPAERAGIHAIADLRRRRIRRRACADDADAGDAADEDDAGAGAGAGEQRATGRREREGPDPGDHGAPGHRRWHRVCHRVHWPHRARAVDGSSISFIKSGKLKVLGVVNEKRVSALPEVPTIDETIKGFGSTPWYGLFAPAGTPKAIVAQLEAPVTKVLDAPDTKEKLAVGGCEPFKSTPEQFAALIKDDLPKWARIVKYSGATVD